MHHARYRGLARHGGTPLDVQQVERISVVPDSYPGAVEGSQPSDVSCAGYYSQGHGASIVQPYGDKSGTGVQVRFRDHALDLTLGCRRRQLLDNVRGKS